MTVRVFRWVIYWTFLVCLLRQAAMGKPPFEIHRKAHKIGDEVRFYADAGRLSWDESSFVKIREDHLACDQKTTLASKSAERLTCFTDNEFQTQEKCSNGFIIVAGEDQSQPTGCDITKINSLYVWDSMKLHTVKHGFENEIKFIGQVFVFSLRKKWDGLLVQIFYRCRHVQNELCTVLKFTGKRKHPLPTSVQEIFKADAISPTKVSTASKTKEHKDDGDDEPFPAYIIGVALGSLVLMTVIGFLVYCQRRRKQNNKETLEPLYNTCGLSTTTTTTKKTNSATTNGTLYTEPKESEREYKELEPEKGIGLPLLDNKSEETQNDGYSDVCQYSTAHLSGDDIPKKSTQSDTLNGVYSTADENVPRKFLHPTGDSKREGGDTLNGYSTVRENNPPKFQPANNSKTGSGASNRDVYSTVAEAGGLDSQSSKEISDDSSRQGTLNYYSIPIDEGPRIPPEILQQYAKVKKKNR